MKNVEEQWKRNCLCIPCNDFEYLVEEELFDNAIAIGYCYDYSGWYVGDNEDDIDEDAVKEELEKYFDIKITSIHADAYQPCCFWISYKE